MARKESERPKNIIQSYLVTSAKYDFNVYEKRILYRIVELLQCELEGKSLGRGISIEPTLYNDRVVSMPVHHFLRAGEKDKNHHRIKTAFKRLQNRIIEKDTTTYWEAYPVVSYAKVEYKSGMATFKIDYNLYRDLLDFAKGYNQYELQIAFSFRSQYTMRFYEMISRASSPALTYSLLHLREIFMLQNRYKENYDFFKKVIDPAQKELETSRSPYFFAYDKIKTGRTFTHVKLRIYYRAGYDRKIPQQTSLRWDVNREFLKLLNYSLGTTDKTWKPHRELLVRAQHIDYNKLKRLLRKAQSASNPVGYVVNSFKRMDKDPRQPVYQGGKRP